MQTGPRFYAEAGNQARPWAVMLVIGYVMQIISELSFIRFFVGEDGRWIATIDKEPGLLVSGFYLITFMYSVIATIGFLANSLRSRSRSHSLFIDDNVSGNDVIFVIAWLHVLTTLLLSVYMFLLPFPFFQPGTLPGMLESASQHIIIVLVMAVWFRQRGSALGFVAPRYPIGMFVSILVFLLFIVTALDWIVTQPVADLFGLALESEREQGIQSELVEARGSGFISGLFSAVIIGIFVPIAEELLFRGVIQSYLVYRWGAVLGIIITSFWFALIHYDIALLAPLFAIGVALGFMRHYFQSIWPAIFLHSLNNLASVLYYML